MRGFTCARFWENKQHGQGENNKVNHLEIMKLLPWYVNRTLAKEEQQTVVRHLEHCGSCIWEVEELRLIKASVLDLNNEVPRPSRDLWHLALAQIQRGSEGSLARPRTSDSAGQKATKDDGETRKTSFWNRLGTWVRGELAPAKRRGTSLARWAFAPAAAMVLLLIVGFQNLLYIPRLRTELATLSSPAAIEYHVIHNQARSESQKAIEMLPGQPFIFLEIDVNPPNNIPLPPRFLIEVGLGDGSNPAQQFEVEAGTHLFLRLPTEGLEPGAHTMIVKDSQKPIDAKPLGKYRFQLRLKGGNQ